MQRIHSNTPSGCLKPLIAPSVHCVFSYPYIPMIKFNLELKHTKSLAKISNNKIIIIMYLIKVVWTWRLSLSVSFLKYLFEPYSPSFMWWCEMIKFLCDERKWGEWLRHWDDYWHSDDTSRAGSSTSGLSLTAGNWGLYSLNANKIYRFHIHFKNTVDNKNCTTKCPEKKNMACIQNWINILKELKTPRITKIKLTLQKFIFK